MEHNIFAASEKLEKKFQMKDEVQSVMRHEGWGASKENGISKWEGVVKNVYFREINTNGGTYEAQWGIGMYGKKRGGRMGGGAKLRMENGGD